MNLLDKQSIDNFVDQYKTDNKIKEEDETIFKKYIETLGKNPMPPVLKAGKLTKQTVRTPQGPRKVRLGPRGGKYVIVNNKKVSLSKLPKYK